MASGRRATFCLAAGAAAVLTGALGLAAGGLTAQACGRDCGGRGAYAPAPLYSAPPVYSYSCSPYAGCTNRLRFYTTRVNIFRGPRWGYAAAYYNARPHGRCGRRAACVGAYLSGPIVPISGPIGRHGRR
jgi:hypothetical protein